jgi:hypothetical protein
MAVPGKALLDGAYLISLRKRPLALDGIDRTRMNKKLLERWLKSILS